MDKSKLYVTATLVIGVLLSITFMTQKRISNLGNQEVDISETRPIPIRESPWMEELTWMEIRDLIKRGYTTVILPTGGIEQNGPNVITGKHNKIAEIISEAIAQKLGQTLIAPVVKFVPEGNHNPPTGHMHYPGTLGVTEETYQDLLREICLSLKLHGFQTIVLLGDSGGNQPGMEKIASTLNEEWSAGASPRLIYAKNYYFQDQWSYEFLKSINILQMPDTKSAQRGDVHSDYHYEAMLAAIDPNYIRAEERQQNDTFSINSVSLSPLATTIENGKLLIEYRAQLTVDEIKKQRSESVLSH